LSARADISTSRAYTYLVSFVRIGLVEQNETSGQYDLGENALQLGISALTRSDIIELAREAIIECRNRTGATVFLSLFGNMGPAVVYSIQGAYPVTVQVRAGSVLPIIGSATGNIFLAYLDDEATAPHIKREAGFTNQNVDALDKNIKDIRACVLRDGFSTIQGGLVAEVSGIAAPIFDHENRLSAVMTMIGSKGMFDVSHEGENAQILNEIAKKVSFRMGANTSKV